MEIETWQLFTLLLIMVILISVFVRNQWCKLNWIKQKWLKEKAINWGVFIFLASAGCYFVAYTIKWNMTH